MKGSSPAGTNWRCHDTERGINQRLEFDNTGTESDEGNVFSVTSNGFRIVSYMEDTTSQDMSMSSWFAEETSVPS